MLLALALLLVSGVSPSEERDARSLVRRSLREYESAQFDAALADIKQAYLLDPRPQLLFNLGQCERAMHHWELAGFAFDRYLRAKPAAANRTLVESLIRDVQLKLKAEAAASAAPAAAAPAPRPVLVEAAPPPPVAPEPVWSVETPVAEKRHTHALAWTLGAVGLAAGLVAGFGAYEIASYDSQVSAANATPGSASGATLAQQQKSAQIWQPVSIALGAVALAGLVAAGFTW